MKTLVDIGDRQIHALDMMARKADTSRAAIIRTAIDTYLTVHAKNDDEDFFGLWGSNGEDGLAYQMRLRDEW